MRFKKNEALEPGSLDPHDWSSATFQFHRALDLAFARQRSIRKYPVWTPPPPLKNQALPQTRTELKQVINQFQRDILPYSGGNTHPKFFGWVHGSGNLYGALGEALAAVMNCNVGGRNHIGTSMEKVVVAWFRDLFKFPASSGGILTTGTSMGTTVALDCARNTSATWDVQREGLHAGDRRMVAYASSEAHSCVTKTLDLLGIGRNGLRLIPVDADFRMDVAQLKRVIQSDRAKGLLPFCIISTAGSVNTGAFDDIAAIARIARHEKIWHHVDGAFGAFSICIPRYRGLLSAIRSADSIAFDLHKWLHVPYDVGCVLIRKAKIQRQAFSLRPEYLQSHSDGIAGGEPWFCDYGPELSRGFRALKVWFTLKALGFNALSAAIVKNCRQAKTLAQEIALHPQLELLAPVSLNIVCFRVRPRHLTGENALNELNRKIISALQNRGLAVPSSTKLSGKIAIRVCLTNHRTRDEDLRQLIKDVLMLEAEFLKTKRK